ncbi:unnamed protein product [Sphagnum balticum]
MKICIARRACAAGTEAAAAAARPEREGAQAKTQEKRREVCLWYTRGRRRHTAPPLTTTAMYNPTLFHLPNAAYRLASLTESCMLSIGQIAFLAQRRLPPSTKNAGRRPRPHTAVDQKLSLSPKASYRLRPETQFEAESAMPPSLSHQSSSLLSRSCVLGYCGLAFFCA